MGRLPPDRGRSAGWQGRTGLRLRTSGDLPHAHPAVLRRRPHPPGSHRPAGRWPLAARSLPAPARPAHLLARPTPLLRGCARRRRSSDWDAAVPRLLRPRRAGRLERLRPQALDPHDRGGQAGAASAVPSSWWDAGPPPVRQGRRVPSARRRPPARPASPRWQRPRGPRRGSPAAELGQRRAAEPSPGRRGSLDSHPDAGSSQPAGRLADPVGRTGPPADGGPRAARR